MSRIRRILNLFRANSLSVEINRELASHIAELTDALVRSGMRPEDAAREAQRRFGNPTALRERTRDADVSVWLDALFADVRYALRALRRSPGFTVVAVASLALGIGANTAIFTVTNAVAIRTLPVREPDALVSVQMGTGDSPFTNPLWEQIRPDTALFAGSLAYASTNFNLAQGGEVRRVNASWVSGGFFDVLGVRPAEGRLISSADDVRGCGPVAVVSAPFARREWGAAPVAGTTLHLNGYAFSVIGVTDAAFTGVEVGRPPDVYVPLCTQAIIMGRPDILDLRSRWFLSIIARVKPGVSEAQVDARLAALAPSVFAATVPPNWSAADQAEYRKNTLRAEPAAGGISEVRSAYRGALVTLMAIVGVVLLIACANIAQLLLARAAARRREIAVRLAIGVGPSRLMRQMLTESLILALGGAALGALFAAWASRALVGFLSTGSRPIWLDLSLDWRVLGFTAAVATATGVLFGIAPAWRAAKVDPQDALKSGGRGVAGGRGHQRAARPLVIAQVALSLTLVTGGALLVGTFRRIVTLDPGFRRDGVALVTMNFSRVGWKDRAIVNGEVDVLNRIRAVPGVTSASASVITPIGSTSWNDFLIAPGLRATTQRDSLAWFNQVSDGYFATMGIPLLLGRDISADDIAGARRVAVVSESVGKRLAGDDSPLGRTFRTPVGAGQSEPYEVIGVVADTKYQRLTEDLLGTAYFPLGVGDTPGAQLTYSVRTPNIAAAVAQARAIAAATSPALSFSVSTLEGQVSQTLARPRLLAVLSGFFAALALLLAVVGLYGAMAYSVVQRRSEIGVRMALGAARSGILALVASEALRIVGLGVVLGALAAFAATRVLSGFLFGISAQDPVSFALSAALLLFAGLAASLVPAWRATRVDPTEALRVEQ